MLCLIFFRAESLSDFKKFSRSLPRLYFGRRSDFCNHFIMHCYLVHSVGKCLQGLDYSRQPLPRLGNGNDVFHLYPLTLNCIICTLLYNILKKLRTEISSGMIGGDTSSSFRGYGPHLQVSSLRNAKYLRNIRRNV